MFNSIKRLCCCCICPDYKLDQLKCSTNNIAEFSLNGYNTLSKIVDVYDGDTCKGVLYLDNKLTKFTIRMNGYDTPEIRTNDAIEKEYGIAAKIIVSRMILNKIVYLKCGKWDKYGRLLADIYMKTPKNTICLNDWIIKNNLGVKYDGKTKSKFIANLGDEITVDDIINKYDIPYIEDMEDWQQQIDNI
jgi:endonuclease YncB( thermonuclease family)